jgi:thiol-disulfide isomerase/thioredoxin
MLLNQGRGPKDFDPQTYVLLDEARRLDPENIEALYTAGTLMRAEGRNDEAVALLEKAAAVTNATRVHREYWAALRSQKRDAVPSAIEALLARDANPGALLAAAAAYYDLGNNEKYEELHARILREAPASLAAQWVLNDRYAKATPEGGARLAAARAFVAWPHHYETTLLANAHRNLFFALRGDPSATDAELLAAIRGMHSIAGRQPASDFSGAAIALADRKLALDEAESLAREGLTVVERHLETLRARGIQNFEDLAAYQRAQLHDALGWVLLQRDKKREAEKELLAARELQHELPLIAYHLGKLYESQKKLAEAEEMYRRGFLMPSQRANPNLDALKAIYQSRFGSLEGFEESMKQVRSLEVDARRKKVLGARVRKTIPPFKLKTLDGKAVALADLKGRIAVINVWAVWCGPCVREMPAVQELVKKYAADPKVVIITLNTDDDAQKVRRWMAEQKYDFPVLLDNGYARRQVWGYPTTWFLDPAGTMTFEKLGGSEKLVEEFSWRIEALR